MKNDAPLLALLLEIRNAAGDPYGKLMQSELVEKIRELKQDSERLDHLEANAREMPRWVGTPSMDGRFPAWSGYTPKYGRTNRKTLREMIDAAKEPTVEVCHGANKTRTEIENMTEAEQEQIVARLREGTKRPVGDPASEEPTTTVGSTVLVGGSTQEETNFRWAYAAIQELAKIELAKMNKEVEGGEWPAGQEWHELGNSSRSIFMHKARDLLGINHKEFLEGIRNGKYDVEDIYEQ